MENIGEFVAFRIDANAIETSHDITPPRGTERNPELVFGVSGGSVNRKVGRKRKFALGVEKQEKDRRGSQRQEEK
jgi:hypothetical protein